MALTSRARFCRALLALFAASLCACANDPGSEENPATDAGGDGSGDAAISDAGTRDAAPDPACEGELVPFDGDLCACEGASAAGTVGLCERSCGCDNGFWSCEETCEEPDVLALRWSSAPTVAEVDGDGDADIEAGERWSVVGAVAADNAPESGVAVELRLDTLSGRVDIIDGSGRVDGVGAEGVDFALPFDVDADASEGSVAIDVEAFTVDGLASVDATVALEIVGERRPELTLREDGRAQVTGDGNRFVDPGEQWSVTLVVSNIGAEAAEGLSLALTSDTPDITVDTAAANTGALAAGESASATFEFTVAASPASLTPVLTASASSTSDAAAALDVPVAIEAPDTLRWGIGELIVRQAAGAGNGDAVADIGETWEAELPVYNDGTVVIEGLSVSVTNFETPVCGEASDCGASGTNRCDGIAATTAPCDTTADCAAPGVCAEGFCQLGACTFSCADGAPCFVGTCDGDWCLAPVYASASFALGSAPGTLTSSDAVVATVVVAADTPALARVFFSATSDVRTRPHASAAVDIVLPVP